MKKTIQDDVLGELTWSDDESSWNGQVEFLGLQLPLSVELDLHEPSEEERRQAVKLAREQFVRLDTNWESQSKQVAAKDLIEAVYQQAEAEPVGHEVGELIGDMLLRSLDFIFLSDEDVAVPCLSYVSPSFFPDMQINIQFRNDLSIDEVTLEE